MNNIYYTNISYDDGFGSQYQKIIQTYIYCKMNNLPFAYTPLKYVEHNYYINDKIFDLNIQRRIDNVNIQINFIREKIEIINFINKNEKVPI